MDLLSKQFDKLATRAERAKESIQFAINPDHRHDEARERAEDEERRKIAESHRFGSFADVREGNQVKWFISGHDYFYAVSEILENAKETIWIADWWLTPELFLRRPPAKHEEYRLDRLLLRKAQQGVQIFIMEYKEVTQTMTMSSAHTKHHLEALHENIRVVRHPDHLGGEVVLYWSHHEKIVVVDAIVACIGGLDLCFGRWDLGSYPLSDVHPTDFSRTLFAGQDYNNARVHDFEHVDVWASNQISRLESPRMPWHDVHSMLVGPAVLDIAEHFVERWNFIRDLKYKHDTRYPILAFPHRDNNEDFEFRHPHMAKFKEVGRHFHVRHRDPEDPQGWDRPIGGPSPKGTMRVQVLRSSADWSSGILTEHSIQNAYVRLIREARHYIYIENQFFIAGTEGKGPISNVVGAAIVERVLSAARAGQKFKVVIVIPAIPGFAGDLLGNSGTLAIMGAQYECIRGKNSIFEQIKTAGFKPHDFIEFYNLRSYDRINNDPDRIRGMAERSGVTFEQAQAALARIYLGRDVIRSELDKNKNVKFGKPQEGGEQQVLSDKKNEASTTIEVPLPLDYDEALSIITRFEQADEVKEEISDSVAHHSQAGQGSLLDEKWSGTEESERQAYVSELLYIHSKIMIVDDSTLLIGSANLNDRSQNGDRDSEIAMVVEDFEDLIDSRMNGKDVKVSRFAASLRRQLYADTLLGLTPPQFCPPRAENEPVTPSMRPVGSAGEELDPDVVELVTDPLDPRTEALLRNTAAKNAEIFESLFHCVPTNAVTTWDEYKQWIPQAPVKPNHVADPNINVRMLKTQLDQVKGHVVAMPLDFLSKERLLALDASVNPLTLSIYL